MPQFRAGKFPPNCAPASSRPRARAAFHFAFRIFTWPHPTAWRAVAAGWIAIAALNFSGPRGETLYAVTPKDFKGRLPSAQEYLVQMDLQRRLVAALEANSFEPRPVYYLRRQDL